MAKTSLSNAANFFITVALTGIAIALLSQLQSAGIEKFFPAWFSRFGMTAISGSCGVLLWYAANKGMLGKVALGVGVMVLMPAFLYITAGELDVSDGTKTFLACLMILAPLATMLGVRADAKQRAC